MEIKIQSSQPSIIHGEGLQIELTLRNTGAEAVALPALDDPSALQPYFQVRGPSFPAPYRFHWRGKPPKAAPPVDEMIKLAPGASTQAVLGLPASLAFATPGAHELFAAYEWRGAVVESNRITVKVEAPAAPLFRVVGRTPLRSEVGIQALSV